MPIDPKSVEPRSALQFLAAAAMEFYPLKRRDEFEAAVQRLGMIVDDYLAREAIARDVGKTSDAKPPADA